MTEKKKASPAKKKSAADGKRATSKAAKPKTAKAKPARQGLSIRQVAERDSELVRLRLSFPNMTWAQITAQLSALREDWTITPDHARKAFAAWSQEKQGELATLDALEAVQEHLAGLRDVRTEAARTAREASGGFAMRHDPKTGEDAKITIAPQPAVALGALRLMAEMHMREVELLQQAGLLPKNLGRIELELDQRRTVEVVIAILHRYVGDAKAPRGPAALAEARAELVAALTERAESVRDALPALPAG